MQAWRFTTGFGYGNLRLETGPAPRAGPGPGEVLLEMRAASLKYLRTTWKQLPVICCRS